MNRKQHTDDRGFLKQKLEAAEWPVDPAVWQAVSAKVGASSAAGASVSAAAGGLLPKVALWLGVAAFAVATVVAVVREANPSEEAIAQPVKVQPSEPTPELQPAAEVDNQTNSSDEEHLAKETKTEARGQVRTEPETTDIPKVQAETTPEPKREVITESLSDEVVEPVPAEPVSQATEAISSTDSSEKEGLDEPQSFTVDFLLEFDDYDELQVHFDAVLSENADCEWDFGDGNTAIGPSPTHRYSEEGNYLVVLVAQDDAGRRSSFEAEVQVARTPKLILPNIFTPNNDGLNDLLTVAPDSQNITVERMVVMDAMGRLVHEEAGENAAWDGTLPSGEPAQAGSYRLVVSARTPAGERIHESIVVQLSR